MAKIIRDPSDPRFDKYSPEHAPCETGVFSVKRGIRERIGNRKWRMRHLYSILDKEGQKVLFKPNWAQIHFMKQVWYRNIILKARQLGFSTLIALWFLDACLFNSNLRCGIIAHRIEDAEKIFRDKIKFAYNNLPDWVKLVRPIAIERSDELVFENNSSIRVSTSYRSGTIQFLHISEYGKICRQFPERAAEIRTGALNAVPNNGMVFIESTAEGNFGDFYEKCMHWLNVQRTSGAMLTRLDYAFHFYPWWKHPEYKMDKRSCQGVVIPTKYDNYFNEVEGVVKSDLSYGQRVWYYKKSIEQGDEMKREYPATPEEAFESSVKGMYFRSEFTKIREEGRICRVPVEQGVEVNTAWDLGMNDTTCIWFYQDVGREVRIIDYYENSGEGLEHYAKELDRRGYLYGEHLAPHDIQVRELGTGTSRYEVARKLGLKFRIVPKVGKKEDSIEMARNLLSMCWFDEARCDDGLVHLENYRKQYDENLGTYKTKPLHDQHSNGADAFQTLAMGHKFKPSGGPKRFKRRKRPRLV